MTGTFDVARTLGAVVNLNGPGRYLHWSIFTVSEANLVLIAVMMVIFGAALTIPFPGHAHRGRPPQGHTDSGDSTPGIDTVGRADIDRDADADADAEADPDASMWTF